MKVLITGANGFLGSHLVDTAIDRKYKTFAAVRKGSDLSNLASSNPEIIYLDYGDAVKLTEQLTDLRSNNGQFDLIIHNAGLTIASRKEDFEKINVGITRNMITALQDSDILDPEGKLIYVSSLAARGPDGILKPISSYGKSKLASEKIITNAGYPFVIVRPTAVYGPRDADFLKLFKIIKKGVVPSMAPKSQKITMIYVKDLANLILDCHNLPTGSLIEAHDGGTYRVSELNHAIGQLMNKKAISIPIPGVIANPIAYFSETLSRVMANRPFITREKIAELTTDWTIEPNDMVQDNFKTLNEGLKETYDYYQNENLI